MLWDRFVNKACCFEFFFLHLVLIIGDRRQVSHWGSKLAICRALTTLCADAAFAQSLFRSTGLATVINVIRTVSTTSCHNAYPSPTTAFGASASASKTAKQTPSFSGSGLVVGEVEGASYIQPMQLALLTCAAGAA